MKKAYILDLNILAEHNLTIEEFAAITYLDQGKESKGLIDNACSLQEKQFIKIIKEKDEEIYILREKSKLLLEFLEIESLEFAKNAKKIIKRSSRSVVNDLDTFIEEFRSLWKGLKPGSMGSTNGCREKMIRWMKENPQYNREDILRASRVYIQSLDNYQYLQQADYFIYKKDARGESSRLSAFIDEKEIKQEGWSSNLN
jgi:hypothetical protein